MRAGDSSWLLRPNRSYALTLIFPCALHGRYFVPMGALSTTEGYAPVEGKEKPAPAFVRSASFDGPKEGYIFKKGPKGTHARA